MTLTPAPAAPPKPTDPAAQFMNLTAFFDAVRPMFAANRLSQAQVVGMVAILNGWFLWIQANPKVGGNLRWLAYMLATVFHETGQAMIPVRELGYGQGRAYGKPAANGLVYYGRGLVQLTWERLYILMGQLLKLPLHDQPDLALDPKISVDILILGMVGGHYTGARLATFFGVNPKLDRPVDARAIVNGTDRAELIASYHQRFLAGLVAAGAR